MELFMGVNIQTPNSIRMAQRSTSAATNGAAVVKSFDRWYARQKWNDMELPRDVKRSEAGAMANAFEKEISRMFACPSLHGHTIGELIDSGLGAPRDGDSDSLKMFRLLLLKFGKTGKLMRDSKLLSAEHAGRDNTSRGDSGRRTCG